MEEAVELFTRAVDLSDDEYEKALLWRAIGEAQALRYDGEGMRLALLRAVDGPLSDAERADVYAFLAFQSAYLKTHWPQHFYAAALTVEARGGNSFSTLIGTELIFSPSLARSALAALRASCTSPFSRSNLMTSGRYS